LKPHEAPIPGGYSVVTAFDGAPLCVIRTVGIEHLPFADVDAQMAWDEGEGDQSLGFWREVHWRYFCNEAAGLGIGFDERSVVCCERFECLFPR
jgi:uncharacterized protein YhfF